MWRENQLDATQWFIELIIRFTCFGHNYSHLQELETIQMVKNVAHDTLFVAGLWSVVEL